MNKLILTGNLGRDPEMRYTPQGQAVTSFSLAVNRKYTNGAGEAVQETIWFRVQAWGKLAEVCNTYLKKGAKTLVVGRLAADKSTGGPRIWTAKDGTPHADFEVVAESVEFLGGTQQAAVQGDPQAVEPAGADEDIPF
ncbi:MAG: single-stranded DNA-binding protein [Chloroflexota bacterium]|nr:single-stranded DNA-binding protein [Chloroflexota bacterium]GIK44015.1 MAG: single-stranded DNA-binding protein [Chloroflexota bacterium]